ncbi:hypothetical protein B9Z55_013975 [Caenorhabditis nigoni]|uniref:EGF-like domain-containing protein n=1 Tax=Caenorhabditis nigoni TaxID=1611254 RepID=A0A2G5U417_9PELO|nr:hypothetical protein B9Z55_013975 [Caenorhabditis nigoni]
MIVRVMKFFVAITFLERISSSEVKSNNFDPDDCYEPGTNFKENEKNLGYCPCKYGYGGPTCFEIFDCVSGHLRMENCSREIHHEYDLQWRCAATENEIVKICTCPEGFRGETCEFILENTISTYWQTVGQSQKFFEVIYNKTDSCMKIIGTKVLKTGLEYRRLIMVVTFIAILGLAWRHTQRQRKRMTHSVHCQLARSRVLNLDNFKNPNFYHLVDSRSLEEADELPEKKRIEEDSVSRFTEVSEVSEDVDVEISIPKVSRPHLHI